MRVTTDTYSGKPFRWNETIVMYGIVTVSRVMKTKTVDLHPSRVPVRLLNELNPGRRFVLCRTCERQPVELLYDHEKATDCDDCFERLAIDYR